MVVENNSKGFIIRVPAHGYQSSLVSCSQVMVLPLIFCCKSNALKMRGH